MPEKPQQKKKESNEGQARGLVLGVSYDVRLMGCAFLSRWHGFQGAVSSVFIYTFLRVLLLSPFSFFSFPSLSLSSFRPRKI